MDTAHLYAEITKADENPDGTMLVRGLATDPTLDVDDQIADPEWLKTAMPEWFKWGNVREMHGATAAGVATEYVVDEGDRHEILAHVVDPGSVAKIKAGVLKGFSIGVRRPRIAADKAAKGGRIVGGQIIEVSLVDRPANPACTLTLAKSAKPGMSVRADAYDAGSGLVRVEEYAEVTEGEDVAKAAVNEPLEGAPVADPEPAAEPAEDTTDSGASAAPAEDAAGEGGSEVDAAADVPVQEPAPAADAEPDADPGDTVAEPVAEPEPVAAGDGVPVADKAATPDATPDTTTGQPETAPDSAEDDRVRALVKEAVADLLKRDYDTKDRKDMAGKGQAMPGGGFPIKTVADLKNAISAIGRAKDPAAAKKHIIARAEALGRSDLIPDGWDSTSKAAGVEEMAHDEATLRAVRDGLLNLIIAEAREALQGEREEYDLRCLLEALGMFLCWWDNESWDGEAPAPSSVKAAGEGSDTIRFVEAPDLTKSADGGCDGGCCDNCGNATKAAAADTTTDPDAPAEPAATADPDDDGEALAEAAEPDTTKTSTVEPTGPTAESTTTLATADTVKAAVQEAVRPLLDQIEGLTAELEQVKKAATPGGPVRVRQTAAGPAVNTPEATALRARIASLRATEQTVGTPDIAKAAKAEADRLTAELRTLIAAG